MRKYDFIIVGAGLFGSVFAREATDKGKKVLVLDKRNYIGGNCHTKQMEGIQVHMHGPHIFHTDNKIVWNYINQYATFNSFSYRPRVNYKDNIYSFPINLLTLYQLWGTKTPAEAQRKLNEVRVDIPNPQNLEEHVLSLVGEEVYQTFIYGYTKKHWGKEPRELPTSIIKRIPIRLTYDDNYYTHPYQGIPIGGYTSIFDKLLDGIEVQLECNYLEDKWSLARLSDNIVYTGRIDEFFNYCYGVLEYRSLVFDHQVHSGDFQGVASINYTDCDVPQTRTIEHKHFEGLTTEKTIVSYEYPCSGSESYYPINDVRNDSIYTKYRNIPSNVIFGGRLGLYKYLDMHQTIALALELANTIIL